MKFFVLVSAVVLSVQVSFADSMREVTGKLECTGQAAGRSQLVLTIDARETSTTLELQTINGVEEVKNPSPLVVVSEGNVYIQQVHNELGYNLTLHGKGLAELLAGKSSDVELKGSLSLFKTNVDYTLECYGTLR